MKGEPIRLSELVDWLTNPAQIRFGDNYVFVRVSFFRRNEDGTARHVSTAGPSQAVPVTFACDGFDWDMGRTFMHTPVTLYADYDEWLKWLHGDEDGN